VYGLQKYGLNLGGSYNYKDAYTKSKFTPGILKIET